MNFARLVILVLLLWHPTHGSEALYFPCKSCHGNEGQGNEALDSPAIAGMDADYVATQIMHFRDGVRGSTLGDLHGRQMNLISAILQEDEDVRVLAEYVAAKPRAKPYATLPPPGDGAKDLYAPCSACHGPNGEGVAALGGPPIAWLDDWYVLRQLKNFKNGIRGSDTRDVGGLQMRPSVVSLTGDELQQLAAYIVTLSGERGADAHEAKILPSSGAEVSRE